MAEFTLNVNGRDHTVEVPPDMPLLWVLRDVIGLTGTKYGCGMTYCGACTVHLDGERVKTCRRRVATIGDAKIVTVEGLSENGGHAVQAAWVEEDVPQCGYCQPGQIMAASALLNAIPNPTDADIDEAMSGNVCRCGTYDRIRLAIHRAAGMVAP